ncbi:MAG: polysaccharide deacetylase family protein, partial [Candidatus Margulisiibacteriota bacterium]
MDNQVTILMFHKVVPSLSLNHWGPITLDDFKAQIDLIGKNKYSLLTLSEMERHLLGRGSKKRAVLLTFDDGSCDNYEHVFPFLRERGIPAVFFLCAGYVGTGRIFWWDRLEDWLLKTRKQRLILRSGQGEVILPLKSRDDKIRAFNGIVRYWHCGRIGANELLEEIKPLLQVGAESATRSAMSWAEVRKMQKAGFGFGSHGVEHLDLALIDHKKAKDEIKRSKKILEEKLKEDV